MRWSVALLALACWPAREAEPDFTLDLRGAVSLRTSGRVEHGPAGSGVEPWYSITLGGQNGAAAVVFTRRGTAPAAPGRYLVGEGQLANGGFSGLIITGAASHPTGVFEVQHGVLRITTAADGQLAGEFELHATGFLGETPDEDTWQVTATGRLASRASPRGWVGTEEEW